MSVFRSPLYLDTEIMVPLANYHDIEVLTDVSVSQRDRGERSGRAGIKASLPIPGGPGIELAGGKGSESEVTQERIVKSHPADALNRLLDTLQATKSVTQDLSNGLVQRHQIVEIDGDWEVSPATEIGSLLTSLLAAYAENPKSMDGEPSTDLIASLIGGQVAQGRVVLDSLHDEGQPRVLVLLEADQFVGKATLDDLTEERTVFGQVDAFVSEGANYPLEKFFLSGFNRSIRRAISVEDILSGAGSITGRDMTPKDLKVAGPLVVIKAIAIY